jgi:hypothetical protein
LLSKAAAANARRGTPLAQLRQQEMLGLGEEVRFAKLTGILSKDLTFPLCGTLPFEGIFYSSSIRGSTRKVLITKIFHYEQLHCSSSMLS